jgi:hypothetical protein
VSSRHNPTGPGTPGKKPKRLRFGTFPRPSDRVEVPYAKVRDVHAGASEGELTRRIIDGDAWQQVMAPILDEIDARRGPQALYSAHELEAAILFQRVAGKRGYKEARGLLAGDMHREARELLGFTAPRGRKTRGNPNRWRRAGVPSESTLSRWRTKHFPAQRRADAYAQLVTRLRERVAPLLDHCARLLYLDGTKLATHYTCSKFNPKTGEIVNASKVTCPDGGYVPPSAGEDHSGHGWNVVTLMSEDGVPLAHRVVKLHEGEKPTAVDVLGDFLREIAPLLPDDVRVITADGGFNADAVRTAARRSGCIENIHAASHGTMPSSDRHAAKLRAKRYAIEGYPNWQANGFREIFCACGRGSIARVAWRDEDGRAQVRSQGECATCGSITIKSGRWRVAQNPDRFVRCLPGEKPDLQFGNPLTYDDPMAEVYGKRRRGHQEGAFGDSLTQRFEHVKGKRWFRRKAEAEADTGVVFSIMLALAEVQYTARLGALPAPVPLAPLAGGASSGSPPPLPLAA